MKSPIKIQKKGDKPAKSANTAVASSQPSPAQAVAVARCESHLRPRAYNSGGYAGLFQQATRYWPTRSHTYGQPHRSVYNGRANIIVSIRMAAADGSWSAWGCG